MDWKTELLAVISELIPVIVGAVAGVAGGIGASIHAQKKISKRERYKELRSNLLAVTHEVSKIPTWAHKVGDYHANCAVEEFAVPPSQNESPDRYPVYKIFAIVSLYFPDILDDADALVGTGLAHQAAAYHLLKARFNLDRGKGSQEDVEEKRLKMQNAFRDLTENLARFENITQGLMSKYLDEES